MKKYTKLRLLIIIAAAALLCACGGDESTKESKADKAGKRTESETVEDDKESESGNDGGESGDNAENAVPAKNLHDVMLAADPSLPDMSVVYASDAQAKDLFAYLADFDYDKVEDYFFAYASSGTAEEVAVITLKDESDAKDAADALKVHQKTRKNQFDTYDPSQSSLCESGIIFTEGRYAVLVITGDNDAVKKAFKNAVK